MTILCGCLCLVGELASIFVILVRVPAVATTKLELLFGTLLAVWSACFSARCCFSALTTRYVARATAQSVDR